MSLKWSINIASMFLNWHLLLLIHFQLSKPQLTTFLYFTFHWANHKMCDWVPCASFQTMTKSYLLCHWKTWKLCISCKCWPGWLGLLAFDQYGTVSRQWCSCQNKLGPILQLQSAKTSAQNRSQAGSAVTRNFNVRQPKNLSRALMIPG